MTVQSRFSIFDETVSDVKSLISEVSEQSKYTRQEILKFLREAILSESDTKGIATSKMIKYSFRPFNSADTSMIDPDVYENENNVKMDYYLALNNTGSSGSVETIAKTVYDKQIGLVTIYWNSEGTINPPTIDISLDKEAGYGETYRGSFLSEDERINPIENGIMFDISMFVSRTFSLKWSFAANSDYIIRDTIVKLFLLDSSLMIQNQYDLARIAASNILSIEALRSANEGQSSEYVNILKDRAKELKLETQGKVGQYASTTSTATSISHQYDMTTFADKAFGKPKFDGEWVEIIGNEIKVIRKVY